MRQAVTLVLVVMLMVVWAATSSQAAGVERVSVDSQGVRGNGSSGLVVMSADGRYVAFASEASNLAPGDANDCWDIFVRDRLLGTTERVSVSTSGQEGNAYSINPCISADGRYVIFWTESDNLVPDDLNACGDLFLRDRLLGTTTRVSIGNEGQEANGPSSEAGISNDGRYVVFRSDATNLVSDDTNGIEDIFVRDRELATTLRFNVSSSGQEANGSYNEHPAISGDGHFIVFASNATNLVVGTTNLNVFCRELATTNTEYSLVSQNSAGVEGNDVSWEPTISTDGRYVAFRSEASNLVTGDNNGYWDIFVRDRLSGTTERVSLATGGQEANGASEQAAISGDGRVVIFQSLASNLVVGDSNNQVDIFVYDRLSDTCIRVDLSILGEEVYEGGFDPSISADGRFVAFSSNEQPSNLYDAFVHEYLDTLPGSSVSVLPGGSPVPVRVTFTSVEQSGCSMVTVLSCPCNQPEEFRLLDTYYGVTTTAVYSGCIEIALGYTEGAIGSIDESRLRVYHYNDSTQTWQNITTWIDTANNVVYGETATLSNFAIGVPRARYANFTWLEPVSAGESRLFNAGSTIPVKFSLTDLNGIPDDTAVATLAVYYYAPGVPPGQPVELEQVDGDTGLLFSNQQNGQYRYNLSTQGSEWYTNWTYKAFATLDDGQVHTQLFYLK